MAKQETTRTYEEAVDALRQAGFDLLDAPGTQNRVFLKKYNCSAAIQKDEAGGVKIFAYPGCLISGEIAKLVNRGYQQVLKTSKTEVAATADHLKQLHQFTEELKEAIGAPSLYNESLGTVSEDYVYDRLKGRESANRAPRPWERPASPARKRRA